MNKSNNKSLCTIFFRMIFVGFLSLFFMIGSSSAVVTLPVTDAQQMYKDAGLLSAVPTLFPAPVVAFTDLITGPDTGLGDGVGSGAIVTVWGQRLGSVQGTNTIQFCDSGGTCRTPYVYYWKNADGVLPSGPANLYESHGMQEIAFSVPDSAQGLGSIRITTSEGVIDEPFTVRSGAIVHVKSTGNDDTGNGSFATPWLTIDKADSLTIAGDAIYIHDVTTGDENTNIVIYNNRLEAKGDESNQLAYVSYPNTRAEVIGYQGFSAWNTEKDVGGLVVSKLAFYTAAADLGANDQRVNERNGTGTSAVTYAIEGTGNGRAVGNYITDEHPNDITGACASGSQGAIVGNHNGLDGVSNFKVLGNHIEDYGCAGTIKFHHTTYLSIRSGDANVQIAPPEMSWNYLKDNHARNGIHLYDENNSGVECGSFTDTVVISNNVVVNQGGAGLNIGANCPWTNDWSVSSNILINTGLASAWDGLDINTADGAKTSAINITDGGGVDGGLKGTIDMRNNTIIGWNDDDLPDNLQAAIGLEGYTDGAVVILFNDNVVSTTKDKYFVRATIAGENLIDNISGDGNVWYSSVLSPTNAIPPTWDINKITDDPLLTVTGVKVSVGVGSPIIKKSISGMDSDIYGNVRQYTSNLGAAE